MRSTVVIFLMLVFTSSIFTVSYMVSAPQNIETKVLVNDYSLEYRASSENYSGADVTFYSMSLNVELVFWNPTVLPVEVKLFRSQVAISSDRLSNPVFIDTQSLDIYRYMLLKPGMNKLTLFGAFLFGDQKDIFPIEFSLSTVYQGSNQDRITTISIDGLNHSQVVNNTLPDWNFQSDTMVPSNGIFYLVGWLICSIIYVKYNRSRLKNVVL